MKLEFPKGFLWGAGTSSHQVEGNTDNDWDEWEVRTANERARNSQTYFWWNPNWKKFESEATDPKNYIAGECCDHYNRFREDFDIAEELHHNAHRFSIEWSRVEPEEGKWNEREIEHYREVIRALRERNMEPFVTLLHFWIPKWLARKGGLASSEFATAFGRYSEKMAKELGSDIRFWITINEPDIHIGHAYLKAAWPPQKKNPILYFRALRNYIRAHKMAYEMIKKVCPNAQIGIAKHQISFIVARPTIVNNLLKKTIDWWWNFYILEKKKDFQDFIGVNHYNRNTIDNGFNKKTNVIKTDFGWDYYPESIYQSLVELKKYDKPIYITENGLADASDTLRQEFIPRALAAVHRAISEGVDVRGYLHWSLLDNSELAHGFWLRFGLVEVDRMTQTRTIRPSARIYAQIAKTNTVETAS